MLAGATLLKVNRSEAELLTGEEDPGAAAERLADMGAELVAVTLGPHGALLRGAISTDVDGVPADAVDTTGAGDVVTGVLLAALATSAYSAEAAAEALPAAVAAAAHATEGWGAIDALPDRSPWREGDGQASLPQPGASHPRPAAPLLRQAAQ